MSAVLALNAARAAGIELALDGDDLVLKAASAPPAAMLDALSRHKADIVALLRPGRDGWSGEAAEALNAARAAGIQFALVGDDLALSAASAPPAALLESLSGHKAEIVALLRPGRDGWSAEDWQVYFDERAGIAEFDGRLSRAEAEAHAFECCVVEWLNRNPVCSSPGHCLECGGREHKWDKLLPYGTEPTGHAWLHSRCWEIWHAKRKAKAVATLSPFLRAA